jgi:hypothetical protein
MPEKNLRGLGQSAPITIDSVADSNLPSLDTLIRLWNRNEIRNSFVMKKLLVILLFSTLVTSCKKTEPVVETPTPVIGKWQKSRQIGNIISGGKTTSITKDISSQGAYYEFRPDGSYTESFFDSTAASQPNILTSGKYTINTDELRLVVDNTKKADIRYLQFTVGTDQLYLSDSKTLRLKAIDEQGKLDAQLAKSNSDKIKGIDDFDVLYRLQKQ